MMNFNEFQENVAETMKQRVGNAEVKIQKTMKNNDVQMTGLFVMDKDTNVFPVIYLEKYYQDLSSETFSDVMEEIWREYQSHRSSTMLDTSVFTKWESAKERVVMKVVNYEYNQELLKTVPHDRFLDLAVVYYYLYDCKKDKQATILIRNQHLDEWGVTMDELRNAAYRNYPQFYEISIKSLDEIVMAIYGIMPRQNEIPQDDLSDKIYVVSNQFQLNGATIILFPEKLQIIAEKFGRDLYILPSSIHELLVLPKTTDSAKALREMVHEVNETCVEKIEQLSDNVYCYSRLTGRIEISVD